MTIAVFGGSGRTGRLVVERALEEGHAVRALVRDPQKLPLEHERLELVQGDVLDADVVERTVAGSEAVISVIGRTRATEGPMMGPAGRNIVAAMERHGVRRLVATTGAGVRAPGDRPQLVDRAIVGLMKVIARDALADGQAYADTIAASGLDWTLPRAPRLVDREAAAELYVGAVGPDSGTTLARADFARFALEQLRSDRWLRQMPVVTTR